MEQQQWRTVYYTPGPSVMSDIRFHIRGPAQRGKPTPPQGEHANFTQDTGPSQDFEPL